MKEKGVHDSTHTDHVHAGAITTIYGAPAIITNAVAPVTDIIRLNKCVSVDESDNQTILVISN